MTPSDADRLKAQVEQLTWAQLIALWKWLTIYVYFVIQYKSGTGKTE